MTQKQIRNLMNCLSLMVKDLNDMHNNYDIPTGCENSAREMIKDAIKDFNDCQTTWKATLKTCSKGWYIAYE